MKRAFLLSIFSVLFTHLYAQNYGSPSYYLVDSLDVESISEMDEELLDSVLVKFHSTNSDSMQIGIIMEFVDQSGDDFLREKYNEYIYQRLLIKINEPGLSPGELDFYYRMLGMTFSNSGYFKSSRAHVFRAIEEYYKAIHIFMELEADRELAVVYINLGVLHYHSLEDNKKALDYFMEAAELLSELEKVELEAIYVSNNMAAIYESLGDLDNALKYHQGTLNLSKEINYATGCGMALSHIGNIYVQMDSLDKAFHFFEEAESLSIGTNNLPLLSTNYHNKGRGYQKLGNMSKAIESAELAWLNAKKSEQVIPQMRASELLYELYKESQMYEMALSQYEMYLDLSDSLKGEKIKTNARIKELTYEYEKEKALTAKESEKRLEIAKADRKQQELIIYFIISGLIILIGFVIVIYNRLRVATKQKKVIEKQNDERKVLLKEIHHRVKNNFQIVSSVLKLQAAEEENEIIDWAFSDAVNRIHSMAAVHEMIYKQEDFAAIIPKDYFMKLVESMQSYSIEHDIEFDVDSDVKLLNM